MISGLDASPDYSRLRTETEEPVDEICHGVLQREFRGAIAAANHSGLAKLYWIMSARDAAGQLWQETKSLLGTPERRDNMYFGYYSMLLDDSFRFPDIESPSFFEDRDTGLLNPLPTWELISDFNEHQPRWNNIGLLYHLSCVNNAVLTEQEQCLFEAPLWDRWRVELMTEYLMPNFAGRRRLKAAARELTV